MDNFFKQISLLTDYFLLMIADTIPIHHFIETRIQPIYEFEIPPSTFNGGVLKLKWTCGEGEHGSQISEIWIIKNTVTLKI